MNGWPYILEILFSDFNMRSVKLHERNKLKGEPPPHSECRRTPAGLVGTYQQEKSFCSELNCCFHSKSMD